MHVNLHNVNKFSYSYYFLINTDSISYYVAINIIKWILHTVRILQQGIWCIIMGSDFVSVLW